MKTAVQKIIVIACYLLGSVFAAEAQASKTDSLRAIANPDAKDTTSIKTLIAFAERLNADGKFDEALKYAIAARTNSEKINYRHGIGKSLAASAFIYKLKGAYQAALHDFDEAGAIYEEVSDYGGLSYVHSYMGLTYEDLSEFKKAREHHHRALEYARRSKDKSKIASANVGIGINYYKSGSYEVALEYYLTALKIADSVGIVRPRATGLNNLGVVYEALRDYKKALLYYNKSLELLRQENLQPFIAKTLSNLGGVYIAVGDYAEAKKNLDAAYQLRIKLGDKSQVYTLNNYGDLYRLTKKYDSAEYYYNRSLRLAREMNNLEGSLNPIKGLGLLYLATGKLKKAANQFELAHSIAKEVNSKPWLTEVYLYKAKVDSAQGNFKNAFTWYKLYNHLQDSLFKSMKEEKISYLESSANTSGDFAPFSVRKNDESKTTAGLAWPYLIVISLLAVVIAVMVIFYYRSVYKLSGRK